MTPSAITANNLAEKELHSLSSHRLPMPASARSAALSPTPDMRKTDVIVEFEHARNSEEISESDAVLDEQLNKIDAVVGDCHVHHIVELLRL